jgi:hypothetical protein
MWVSTECLPVRYRERREPIARNSRYMSGLSRFKIGEGYKVMSGLAHLFFCLSSGLLLDGIANDYFAIKMPGSVTENRHNDGEAHAFGHLQHFTELDHSRERRAPFSK